MIITIIIIDIVNFEKLKLLEMNIYTKLKFGHAL